MSTTEGEVIVKPDAYHPRTADEVQAVREAFTPRREELLHMLSDQDVTNEWLNSLDEQSRIRLDIAIGDALHSGRHEGLEFAIGGKSAIDDVLDKELYPNVMHERNAIEQPLQLRPLDDIRAALRAVAPQIRYFDRSKGIHSVTPEWINALPDGLQALIEKARYQGRDEGLGYSIGEDNHIATIGNGREKLAIPRQRPPID